MRRGCARTEDTRAETPETRYAKTSDGVHIAYASLGEGPDLIFIPGSVSNVESFWEDPETSRFFGRLGAFTRVTVLDKRGTGLSDPVPNDNLPPIEVRIDDVRPARAVHCALSIISSLRDIGLAVRAGVHTGEVELRGDGVAGLAVHIGARIAGLAEPSHVLVSSTVKDLTAGSGLTFEDAGDHELKGVPDRWQLYRVVTGEDAAAESS